MIMTHYYMKNMRGFTIMFFGKSSIDVSRINIYDVFMRLKNPYLIRDIILDYIVKNEHNKKYVRSIRWELYSVIGGKDVDGCITELLETRVY